MGDVVLIFNDDLITDMNLKFSRNNLHNFATQNPLICAACNYIAINHTSRFDHSDIRLTTTCDQSDANKYRKNLSESYGSPNFKRFMVLLQELVLRRLESSPTQK
jgi:hypothetical protein